MAGYTKRLFELDPQASHASFESEASRDDLELAPHLRVTQSVKGAFQNVLAGKSRAVNFLAGATVTHLFDFLTTCTSLVVGAAAFA